MANKNQARQGDLFFSEVDQDFPKNLPKRTDGILAHGEVTGHMHQITSPSLEEVDMTVDETGHIFMTSTKDIVISHDEHDDVILPAGKTYRMTRQREYDASAAERERRVAD